MRRLPDWAWRRLERVYFDQRAIRQRELRAEVARQDRILRQWAMWARFAHAHRQCLRWNGRPCIYSHQHRCAACRRPRDEASPACSSWHAD